MSAVVLLPDAWDPAVERAIRAAAPPELDGRFAAAAATPEADFLVAATGEVDAATYDALPRLALVHKWGVGLDTLDLEEARRRGIGVAVTTGANAHAVAEHAVLLMLAALRQLPYADGALREGRWVFREMRGRSRQLSGRTVGILGLGSIGRAVARRLAGFDVELLYHDPVPAPAEVERELAVAPAAFAELLARSDVLTLHCPGGAATHHLVGAAELAAMPAGGHLVNTARGEVVDTTALIAALDAGHLLGAGLDVFEDEPLGPGHPLLGRGDVVLTPHAAGSVLDNVPRVAAHVFGNLLRVVRGEPLPAADVVLAPTA